MAGFYQKSKNYGSDCCSTNKWAFHHRHCHRLNGRKENFGRLTRSVINDHVSRDVSSRSNASARRRRRRRYIRTNRFTSRFVGHVGRVACSFRHAPERVWWKRPPRPPRPPRASIALPSALRGNEIKRCRFYSSLLAIEDPPKIEKRHFTRRAARYCEKAFLAIIGISIDICYATKIVALRSLFEQNVYMIYLVSIILISFLPWCVLTAR